MQRQSSTTGLESRSRQETHLTGKKLSGPGHRRPASGKSANRSCQHKLVQATDWSISAQTNMEEMNRERAVRDATSRKEMYIFAASRQIAMIRFPVAVCFIFVLICSFYVPLPVKSTTKFGTGIFVIWKPVWPLFGKDYSLANTASRGPRTVKTQYADDRPLRWRLEENFPKD